MRARSTVWVGSLLCLGACASGEPVTDAGAEGAAAGGAVSATGGGSGKGAAAGAGAAGNSPDEPQPGFPGAGYGRFAFPDSAKPENATNKWNVVFRRGATPPGVYDFRSFAVVGSLENVRVAMTQLHALVP